MSVVNRVANTDTVDLNTDIWLTKYMQGEYPCVGEGWIIFSIKAFTGYQMYCTMIMQLDLWCLLVWLAQHRGNPQHSHVNQWD